MPTLLRAVSAASADAATWSASRTLSDLLGARVASHVLQGVIRAAFLIELVKSPKIETTKFEVRWATRLGAADPRFATYDQCFEIYEELIRELEEALLVPDNGELLRLFGFPFPAEQREETPAPQGDNAQQGEQKEAA